MNTLLDTIESYWTRRAPSYSDIVKYEMSHENEANWFAAIEEQLPADKTLKVLDIGTGPGFFAIGFAARGHEVTAVDYTPAMLEQARENAGDLKDKITFLKMDAQKLDFPEASFDVVISRNLTWNLERPQDAYSEWHRVLKPGGIMLNFDAGWYSYLYQQDARKEKEETRKEIARQQVFDFDSYSESALMEEISRQLVLSRCERPQADIDMLSKAGFQQIRLDENVGERVWDAVEKINYASTPMFMICAVK